MPLESLSSTKALEATLHWQKKEWIAERIGWGLLVTVIFAGLLGLLGHGPLSHVRQVASDGRLEVDYERFEHAESPAELQVRVRPMRDERDIALQVSESFPLAATLEEVSPRASAVDLVEGGQVYHFAIAEGTAEAVITFRFRLTTFGRLTYQIGVPDSAQVQVQQFVFP